MRAITTMLSESEQQAIHEASLEVLETAGVNCGSEEVRQLFTKQGAKVVGQNVRFPKKMVEEMLKLANHTIPFGARNDQHRFSIPAMEFPYVTTAGYVPYVTEEGAAKPRLATTKDLEKFAILSDALDEFGFFWPIVLPNDVEAEYMEYKAVETSFKYTSKHIQASTSSKKLAKWQIELAQTIAGGKNKMKKNPNMSLLAAPLTPLCLEKGIAEATMVCAQNGIAVVPMSLPQMGSTSPATFAGNTVLANAENLACYLTAKCTAEDAPILYSADTGAPNMVTMGMEYDYPEYTLLAMANADMARFYGLPSMVAAGMSEHKEFQTVAGFERNVFKSAMALLTRTDLSCSFGSVDHCLSSNFADILLDCESYKYAKAFLRSYKCTPEKMATDIICQVGPRGNYLDHEHTFMNFREELNVYKIENSFVFDHEEGKDYRQVAQEKAEAIWANHKVPALDEALMKEMDAISEKAHEDLIG